MHKQAKGDDTMSTVTRSTAALLFTRLAADADELLRRIDEVSMAPDERAKSIEEATTAATLWRRWIQVLTERTVAPEVASDAAIGAIELLSDGVREQMCPYISNENLAMVMMAISEFAINPAADSWPEPQTISCSMLVV